MLFEKRLILFFLVVIFMINFGIAVCYMSDFSYDRYDDLSLSFIYNYVDGNNFLEVSLYWWDYERGSGQRGRGYSFNPKGKEYMDVLPICENESHYSYLGYGDRDIVPCPDFFQYDSCQFRSIRGIQYTQGYPWTREVNVPILLGFNTRDGDLNKSCRSQGGVGLRRLSWNPSRWFNPYCIEGDYILSSDEDFCCVGSDWITNEYGCGYQGSDVCASDEICLGSEMFSSDERCCSIACIKESSLTCNSCSSCGQGFFNICDHNECMNNCGYNDPSSCYFVPSGIGGTCFAKPTIEVNSCGYFNQTGRYVLQNDIHLDEVAVSQGYCFMVSGKDIVLDLNGSSIYGNSSGAYNDVGGIFAIGESIEIKDSDKSGIIEGFESTVDIYIEGSNMILKGLRLSGVVVCNDLYGLDNLSLELREIDFLDNLNESGFVAYSQGNKKPLVKIINSKFSDNGFFLVENTSVFMDLSSFRMLSPDVSFINSDFSLWTSFIGKRISLTLDNFNFDYGLLGRNNSFSNAINLSYSPKYGIDSAADVLNFPELDRPYLLTNEYMDKSLFSISVRPYYDYMAKSGIIIVPNNVVFLFGFTVDPFFNIVMNGFHFCKVNSDCYNGRTCLNYKCVE